MYGYEAELKPCHPIFSAKKMLKRRLEQQKRCLKLAAG